MKTLSSIRKLILAGSIAVIFTTPPAHAATLTWDANAAIIGRTEGAGAWLNADQWWNGSTNTTWTLGDIAIFGVGGAGGAVTLASPTTVGSLTFDYFTGTYTLGTSGQAITLNSGITKNPGPGVATIVSPLTLGGAQTWTNNGTGNINAQAATTLSGALTVGGIGSFDFTNTNAVIAGSGNIIKNGKGQLNFSAGGTSPVHTFTGDITVNGGSIGFQASAFLAGRNVKLTDGYLGGRFGSSFTWTGGLGTGPDQIQITGGTSGLSGEGGTGSVFQIGASLSTLAWGSASFNPTVLLLNGDHRMNTNGKGALRNGIDLNAADRTITSLQNTDGAATSGFSVYGAISNTTGTAGLTKIGPGNLILNGTNTYNGATSVQGGSITLSTVNTPAPVVNVVGTINSTSALNLSGGGTLRLVNSAQVNRFADSAPITVHSGGGVNFENTSGAVVYTETVGAASVTGGQFNVLLSSDQVGAGSQTLTFGISGSSNLIQSGTSAVIFSAAGTGPQASGGKNMISVSGAGSTANTGSATGREIWGPWATTGTSAAAQTDYAVYNSDFVVPAGITASAESDWTNTAYAYTAGLVGTAGTKLGATRNIAALKLTSSTSPLASVTFAGTAATDFITVTGSLFTDGDVVSFGGTAPGGLVAGFPYYVVNSGANGPVTFTVSATSGGSPIDLTSAGTSPNIIAGIALASGNNLGTAGILNTTAAGLTIGKGSGGVVTLPSATSANLYINAGNGAPVIIGAPITDNGTGVLTLVKTGASALRLFDVNTYTGDTAINAGTLQIGINGTTTGATLGNGNYAGNIFIGAGALLDFQTNANQTLSGIISGDGNLLKRYIGTLTLSGNNTYTGKTTIGAITNAGDPTLVVSSFNSVSNPVASSSLGRPTTVANGTIDLGSNNSTPNPTLRHVGNAETTDRVINFIFNSTATRTLATSGSGLLKFTSAFTSNGTSTGHIVLRGNGSGEIAQGLPFAFANLTKSDAGTWTLGGPVGSTGVLTVNAGTLALQKRSSLMGGLESNWTAAKINVKNGATLALNVDSAELAGLNATSLNTLLSNISVASSAAVGLQLGAILGFDTSTAAGGTFTTGNAIADSTGANGGAIGVTKLGVGTLVFDTTNTYTGPTNVDAGTLLVTGSLSGSSAVTVNPGGTLGGIGPIAGATAVLDGGKLSPGTSPGTLTFGSTLDLSAVATTGSLVFELGASSDSVVLTSGALSIGGLGTLGFSEFSFSNSGGLAVGTYTLFDTTTPIIGSLNLADLSGTFAGFVGTLSLANDGNDIVLTVVPEPSSLALLGIGALGLLRRKRRDLRLPISTQRA